MFWFSPFSPSLPWAAHMDENQKSISEIGLRHPLFYILFGCGFSPFFLVGSQSTVNELVWVKVMYPKNLYKYQRSVSSIGNIE